MTETDNSDYPDETFLDLPYMSKENADIICNAINDACCSDDHASRFWRVVENTYMLSLPFEP